jgi:iron(III) transport system substrate-binding protein
MVTILIAACGAKETAKNESSGSSSNESGKLTYDELVKKAKEEGELVIYSSDSPEFFSQVEKKFEDTFGIDIKYTRGSSGDSAQRVIAEHQSGKVQVDVIHVADSVIIDDFKQKGYLEKVSYVAPENADEANALSDGYKLPVRYNPAGIAYDSSVMDEPKSWEDLLKLDKGQFAIEDPAGLLTYVALLNTLREKYGDDFLKEFGKKVTLYNSTPLVANNVVAKEITAGVTWSAVVTPLIQQGSTIKYTHNLDVTGGVTLYQVLDSEAPHPNAALLFMNWIVTKDGQSIFNGNNIGATPFEGIEGVLQVPKGYVEVDYVRAQKERDEVLNLLKGE